MQGGDLETDVDLESLCQWLGGPFQKGFWCYFYPVVFKQIQVFLSMYVPAWANNFSHGFLWGCLSFFRLDDKSKSSEVSWEDAFGRCLAR